MLARTRHCLRLSKVPNYRHAHTARTVGEDARWPGWRVVVGIEVHAQIKSREKLFSNTWTSDLAQVSNMHVSPYDAAFPGTLPQLNPRCVELGVRTAIALNANVHHRSAFDRKHYFYADLPSGYQITQHYAPFATGGLLELPNAGKAVRIHQIQLEQDTGKSTFDARRRLSSIDLNRAGTGLMEIVSEPDMESPEEAGEYVRALQALLRSVGSSNGNMEQGSLRCDVNVSVNKPGEPLGTRCEIKNINSVKFMMTAIASEVFRHIELLDQGQPVAQETRGFDEQKAETYALRSKEDAPDYRYMPDPNIPPLFIDGTYITNIRNHMPELPSATKARLMAMGLTARDADVLMTVDIGREVGYDGALGQGAVSYFDQLAHGRDTKVAVNWIIHELLGQLALRHETFKDNTMSVIQMGELVDLVQSKKITGTSGKTILRHILTHRSSEMPSTIAAKLQLLVSPDTDGTALEAWCTEAIEAMPRESEAVRKGNVNVLNKLLGHVMRTSRGRADAQTAKATLQRLLS
ncbi:Glutamyl-tRNA amidotransferase B subunit [Cristinia sonorae]|uniref:Glutamyl-tRNA(Gln) amidotransferase subunit B, mitochondrial n=1 Tax=Cristinia sonorae TaxID=1940300 RepID=A0A8K0UK88_9AGAR|nr:Glutamyl-tRNA amidotransferase B subunit [Cristinia sonorae]